MKKAIDVNDLEAQFGTKQPSKKAFIIENDDFDEDEIVEFDDNEFEPAVVIPTKKNGAAQDKSTFSNSSMMTVEELESQFRHKIAVNLKSPVKPAIAGPPPGLPPGLSQNQNNPSGANVNNISSFSSGPASILPSNSGVNSSHILMTSTAPLPKYDANREFMNRFERNLIMKIHTSQLTTETPLIDDFYYQALTRKKASFGNESYSASSLLYFPLPSAAERQRELQRRERRRRQQHREREKERDKDKDKNMNANSPAVLAQTAEISADLVLGRVSNSSSRKPRQQLQVPSGISNISSSSPSPSPTTTSLHESVVKGIENVYNSILSVEDFYLIKEEIESRRSSETEVGTGTGEISSKNPNLILPNFDELLKKANELFCTELNLVVETPPQSTTNHTFIHFLTIPKGRAVISRLLKLLNEEGKGRFLRILVEHFDFLEIVRPETELSVIDSFIAQVLSPLVGFVGEADWQSVLESLRSLQGKRSFVWIALTKSGMVLLCILLSRLEILKAAGQDESTSILSSVFIDEASLLTETMFDSLEGHLLEFFNPTDPSRDFYAWQCLALLAMNVESDRKRSMILELRDKILLVVEQEESAVKNLNVFLNALGLDASQLK